MLISMSNVTKCYALGEIPVKAVDGVDLTVEKGEFIGIWGPSGSGKTTLLNLMGAMDRPTTGKIEVNGLDLGRLTNNQGSELRNRFIGFIFQRYNLIPVLSAIENVMLPLQITKQPMDSNWGLGIEPEKPVKTPMNAICPPMRHALIDCGSVSGPPTSMT